MILSAIEANVIKDILLTAIVNDLEIKIKSATYVLEMEKQSITINTNENADTKESEIYNNMQGFVLAYNLNFFK